MLGIYLLYYLFIGLFQDKVVWITGASSGIGEQIALNLSKYGAKLILSARSKDKLHLVKNQCIGNCIVYYYLLPYKNLILNFIFVELSAGKLTNNDILVLPMDVTNISKHITLFDNVISHFGKV